jgi:hypothetical protein
MSPSSDISPYPRLHVPGFYSEYMYRKWYRRQADLSKFVADTGDIPRVTRLTEADFLVCKEGRREGGGREKGFKRGGG